MNGRTRAGATNNQGGQGAIQSFQNLGGTERYEPQQVVAQADARGYPLGDERNLRINFTVDLPEELGYKALGEICKRTKGYFPEIKTKSV